MEILFVLGKALRAIAITVTLDIGLADEVDSVAVAEVVPTRVIGVVASTHCVDIQLFECAYIALHILQREVIALLGVHLVAVYALDIDRLAIDK